MKESILKTPFRQRPTSIAWSLFLLSIAVVGLFASSNASSQQSFDHFSTGFVLDGAHTSVTCESCHAGGTFGPTDAACSSCHSQTGVVRASSKPASHVATQGECSDCHITANWAVVNFIDHSSLSGNCVSCHNGFQATGKTPTHISSGDRCEDCHNTTGWLPANFDHSGLFNNCVSCHDGTTTTGKNPTHVQTSN
ncbi:MAG: hypothetical protein OEM64_13255, partial [Gammaproteobacteria bacterium]|nr:hypothetical protein [Gammaproteobacteria bacterium]